MYQYVPIYAYEQYENMYLILNEVFSTLYNTMAAVSYSYYFIKVATIFTFFVKSRPLWRLSKVNAKIAKFHSWQKRNLLACATEWK